MKRTIRMLLILAVLFVQTSCVYNPPNLWTPGIDSAAVSQTVITFSTELKHERRLILQDSKVYYKDGIEKIKLCYITQDILEMCEARCLLVDVVEGMLERLNNDPIVASQSTFSPLSADQMEVSIICETFWGEYGDSRYINWILLQDGWAHYYDHDLQNHYLDVFFVRNEPYQRSLEFTTFERAAEAAYKEIHGKKKRGFLAELARDTAVGTNPDRLVDHEF